jgi:hypothetical protein
MANFLTTGKEQGRKEGRRKATTIFRCLISLIWRYRQPDRQIVLGFLYHIIPNIYQKSQLQEGREEEGRKATTTNFLQFDIFYMESMLNKLA